MSGPRVSIQTARLLLEPLTLEAGRDLWDAALASQPELSLWMAWAVEPDVEDSFRFYREAERDWGTSSWTFTIRLEGLPVGALGLSRHVPHIGQVDLGYWIATAESGRGYMTEAASAVVDFAFERLGMHRIELNASPDNVGSLRVAEKIGFRREGLKRDGSLGRHGWYDTIVHGLLATDERLRPQGASYEEFTGRE